MIKAEGRVIAEKTIVCSSFLSKAMGLRFRSVSNDEAYVFPFKNPVRVLMDMWFVFSPLDVVFLDERKKVIEIKENFLPFSTYHSREKASFVVELKEGRVKEKNLKVKDLLEFSL